MAKDFLTNIDQEKIKSYAPLAILVLVTILFFLFLFIPQKGKLRSLIMEVKNKQQVFIVVEKNAGNIGALRKEIAELGKQVTGLEERLPEQIKANLLIETLKDITEQAKLKFVSIEPKDTKKFELSDQKQVYLEFPIVLRLKSGYYELAKFIRDIESSKRLMKVSDLQIKADPQNVWEHSIEVTVSTFSALKD
ncbi:MAG: hypothetical protein FJZ11_02685 [Candidatus Omnitrophica bacterium]|nr:hypothetical protein [Candidatus Omnitrophota bacterium]